MQGDISDAQNNDKTAPKFQVKYDKELRCLNIKGKYGTCS